MNLSYTGKKYSPSHKIILVHDGGLLTSFPFLLVRKYFPLLGIHRNLGNICCQWFYCGPHSKADLRIEWRWSGIFKLAYHGLTRSRAIRHCLLFVRFASVFLFSNFASSVFFVFLYVFSQLLAAIPRANIYFRVNENLSYSWLTAI